jgi:hypothetical protein
MAALTRSEHTTYCPYKGDASYYSIPAGGDRSLNAVWTYETPFDAMAQIKARRTVKNPEKRQDLTGGERGTRTLDLDERRPNQLSYSPSTRQNLAVCPSLSQGEARACR